MGDAVLCMFRKEDKKRGMKKGEGTHISDQRLCTDPPPAPKLGPPPRVARWRSAPELVRSLCFVSLFKMVGANRYVRCCVGQETHKALSGGLDNGDGCMSL